ncbi:helix-turn-helix transcriptional regulator [Geothrix sp.]|jgi:transcriptional regulator with XRE-family HTH domain|uniref:helix-turn-helix transcriptional regulator n=1 Tax=Geothrix sp. TaxID=1962974 RepID=UPI0025C47D08|nr:helix-turn-helix transcriptional regulator [Geothrix sp.]
MAVRGPYDSQSASGTPRSLGERIKMLRVQRGLTQVELGEALNSDQATVSLWERDRAKPSGPALAGVASYFSVTVQALETGEGLEAHSALDREATSQRHIPKQGPMGLSDPGPGAALAIDVRTQSEQRLEPMEAMGFLMKALKEGRSVWIVAD